jgi:hypothetical protein
MSYWWPSLVRRIEDSIIEVHLLPFSKTFKRERERLHQTTKNDAPRNICVAYVEFMTRHQPDEYMDKVPHLNECINQLTLGTS